MRSPIAMMVDAMLYYPDAGLALTPQAAGLEYFDVAIDTEDGERLHGWWVRAADRPVRGHVLLFHGNAGNIGDRVLHAALLVAERFDVLLVDYRGYGHSTGRPSEAGLYADARAAREALLARDGVAPERVMYLGESLGGAVAVALAEEHPPAGLILFETFTSLRDMASVLLPVTPPGLVPDAFPSLRRIRTITAPVLVLHGDADELVPFEQGRRLFEAAPGRKRLHAFAGAGHNDLLARAGREWARVIGEWTDDEFGPSDRSNLA